MAAEESNNNLEHVLKPFYQRASEAEDRLARLEAFAAGNKDSGNEEHISLISELQSKLDIARAEQVAERQLREKAEKEVKYLKDESAKLNNRILHLIRAVKEGDSKLEEALKRGNSQ